MTKPKGELVKCDGTMTQGAFNTFIRNLLRAGSVKWKANDNCRAKARVRRGWYKCAECGRVKQGTVREAGKKVVNNNVDHIDPATPITGFVSWDNYIERLFCDSDNLQLLCKPCHKEKCAEEAAERAKHRKKK